MPAIPTPYTLTVRAVTAGPPDDFGNATDVTAERSWPVHFIAPGSMEEPGQSNRDLSLVRYTIGAPKNAAAPGDADKVLVQGEWLDVVGRPDDWTLGPWGPGNAGITVELGVANG